MKRVAPCAVRRRPWTTVDTTLPLLLFLVPLAWSPGPGNMFFAASGACFGFRAMLSANIGYHLATLLVTIAIGLGFGWISREAPLFLDAVRYAGAGYALWLAWGRARSGTSHRGGDPGPARLIDGVMLLLFNPKAYLMFTQFSDQTAANSVGLILWIAVIFTLHNAVAFSTYAALGDRLMARWRHRGTARRLNIGLAAVLAAVAVWMLPA